LPGIVPGKPSSAFEAFFFCKRMVAMKRTVHWVLLVVFVLGAVGLSACGDDDDDNDADEMGNDVCDNLGGLPVESGTMSGRFDFNGSGSFPISITLDATAMSFTGSLSFSDSDSDFTGTCTGSWDDTGNLWGTCTASDGVTDLDIEMSGEVGNNGSCGTWSNQVGQDGDYWVARE